ncbi:hypothetical protein ABVT39_027466 [Epinephelus coioides]
MNIHHVVVFCFLSALCGGNTGLVSAKLIIYTGAEGGTSSISCHLTLTGNMKFFCRNECKGEDILIRTDDVTAQNGRYSIAYSNGSSGIGILTVTITRLTKSDAGRYRCGLGKTSAPHSYQEFGLRLSDTPTTSKPNWTTQPFSTLATSPSTPTTDVPRPVYVLPVVVCVLVVVGLLAGVLLLFYRMKTNRNSDGRNMECVTYENHPPASTTGAIYQNLDPAGRDQEETCHTL